MTLRRVKDGSIVRADIQLSAYANDHFFSHWSPDGKLYWENGAYLRLWHSRDNTIVRQVPSQEQDGLHFTPDSKHLAVATPRGLELRDVLTRKLVQTLPGPRAEPFAFAPDGSFAVSCDKDGKIWKWRLK